MLQEEIAALKLKGGKLIEENTILKGFKAMVMEDPSKYDRDANKKIKELEARLAEVLTMEDEHQKLNGKMQMRLTEIEQENIELHADNKKLARQIEDQLDRARRAGL